MGDLECGPVKDNQMSCAVLRANKQRIDEWVFTVKGKTMDGTLYMDKERIVYRKVHVEKK